MLEEVEEGVVGDNWLVVWWPWEVYVVGIVYRRHTADVVFADGYAVAVVDVELWRGR